MYCEFYKRLAAGPLARMLEKRGSSFSRPLCSATRRPRGQQRDLE